MFAQDHGQYARERVDGSESGLREVLAMRRQMLWERRNDPPKDGPYARREVEEFGGEG